MPEDLNTEIAENVASEDGLPTTARTRSDLIVEIAEAILLGIVAIATAWSGYQAARWDGRQAELYGRDSTTRNQADQSLTLGGQQRLLATSRRSTRGSRRRARDVPSSLPSTSEGSVPNSRSRSTRGSRSTR